MCVCVCVCVCVCLFVGIDMVKDIPVVLQNRLSLRFWLVYAPLPNYDKMHCVSSRGNTDIDF